MRVHKQIILLGKKVISSTLSCLLLLNMTIPSFSQVLSKQDSEALSNLQKTLEVESVRQQELAKFAVRESTRVESKVPLHSEDPIISQLESISHLFSFNFVLPKGNQKAGDLKAQFMTQYEEQVNEEVTKAQRQVLEYEQAERKFIESQVLQARAADVSESLIDAWVEEETGKLNESVKSYQAKITAWRAGARRAADQRYQAALQEVQTETHKQIRAKLQELLDLYKKYPGKAGKYVMRVSAEILLAEGRNTTLFTADEKQTLLRLYRQELKNNKTCSGEEKGDFFHSCTEAQNAVVGIGILGSGFEDASLLANFTERLLQTQGAAVGLLTGMSALLAMKEYTWLNSILYTATQKETDYDVDVSISGMVNFFVNINGQYLGEMSKWAQYPLPTANGGTSTTLLGNAWEDLAHMLADDGSPQALALLNKYSINQCRGLLKTDFSDKMVIACTGIKPFLVGALVSGKYGTYKGPEDEIKMEGYEAMANGKNRYVSADEARRSREHFNGIVNTVRSLAAQQGLDIPAATARSMYLSSMGDLDADNQLALDNKLYMFFNQVTHGQKNLAASVRIRPYDRTSAEYKAKQSRQNRAKIWRGVGFVGDVALLVWCIYDIGRFTRKAVSMGRSAYTAMKMARAGAPVSARLHVLWQAKTARSLTKLNRIFPARIKNAMASSVQNMLPQFTHVQPMAKTMGWNTPSLLDVALPSVDVAENGALLVNTAKVTEVLGESTEVMRGTASLQNSLGVATERANVAFAQRNGLWTRWFGKGDRTYRSLLGSEIANMSLESYRFGDRARLVDFAASVRSNPAIHVPEGVRNAMSIPLVDANGAVNMQVLRMALEPVVLTTTSENRVDAVNAINLARQQTGLDFTHRGRLATWKNTLFGQNRTVYNQLLSDNLLRLTDNAEVLPSFSANQRGQVLGALASTVRYNNNISIPLDINRYAGLKYTKAKVSYANVHSSLFGPGQSGMVLPFEFNIDRGVNGVSVSGGYQRVLFTEKGGNYFMGLTNGLNKPTNLSNFKIDIPSYNLPELIRGTYASGVTTPLELKLTPYSRRAFTKIATMSGETVPEQASSGTNWLSNLWAARRNKTNIWTDEVPVFMQTAGGTELAVPLLIKADTRLGLSGSRFVLGTDDKLHLMKGTEDLFQKNLFRFSLPKQQITPLVNMGKMGVFNTPLRFTVNSGRNKLMPLYVATGLSLSSASVGLIAPLETTYRDRIDDTDKTLISLAFPYLPSVFAPALSPIVMRLGALRVVQTALLSVAAGLAFTWGMGFNGHLDDNHLPPIWPLFVSGTAIGVSSALSRSGLNILIDTMGGGGSLLKSMAFKNLGSLFLLAPSFTYGAYKLGIEPKLKGNELSEEELAKPATDFSLAFPVLTTVTLGTLGYLSTARIDKGIGRAHAVLNGGKMRFWPEMGQAWKTTFAGEVLPLSAAAFFFTGFEASAFSKASNQALRPMYEEQEFVKGYVPGNRKNLVALLTGGTVAAMPFVTRMLSKPTLRALSNPMKPAIEYKRMLWGSYALNAAGGLTLMNYGMDDNAPLWKMGLGIGLMGFGTANVTQSLQKLANIKIGSGATLARLTQGMDATAAAQRASELKTMTMTGFSWSQIGLAAVPLLQSSYVDREVSAGVVSKEKGPLTSIWIPMTSLGLSFGLASKSLGLNFRLPMGSLGGTKLLVDGPSSFNPVPYISNVYDAYRSFQADRMNVRIEQNLKFEQVKEDVKAERESKQGQPHK